LWERANVLESVDGVLHRARARRGGALFVIGEAGLGKTAVLEHARARAATDMDVGFGRGEIMEQVVAFGVGRQVAKMLDAPDPVDPTSPVAEPSVPYHRTARWLADRSGPPLLLALDDLHWADADSLHLFAFLARRLAGLPVALIGTMRPWPPDAELACGALAEAGAASIERLAPLTPASVGEVLADRAGAEVEEATARRAFELSSGNPLLVEQLAAALTRGEPVPAGGLAETLLLSRFAGLDADGLACARAASVLGTRFRPELACEIAGLHDDIVDRALDGLVRSGLVVDADSPAVRFAHPLFAQAVYDDLPPPVRRRLHARALKALAARGLDAEAAEHAVRAELHGDDMAIETLERAGRAALAAGATVTAARNLEAAVRFSGDRASAGLLLALCEALTACGRVEEAAAACRRLVADPRLDWEERVEALRLHGRALYLVGAPDHGEGALMEAADLAAAHDPARAVRPLLDLTLAVWLAEGPRRAAPIGARACELGGAADADLRQRATATWGHIALEAGDPAGLAATEPVGDALDGPDAARLLDPAELTWPWAPVYQFAMNRNYVDRHDTAERTFRRAREVVEQAGAANALAVLAIYIANAAIRSGRLEAALEEAIRACEFSELTPGALAYAHLERAEVLAWLGRLEESEGFCAQAEALASDQWFARLWLAHVRGMRLLWQGDGAASDELRVAEQLTREAGIREPCHVHWQSHAVAAHLAAGREDDAVRVVEWVEECAQPLSCRWPRIVATLGRAQLESHAGVADAAEARFQEALDLHAQVDFPLHRVETLLAYGGFLRGAGRPADARPHFAEALRVADATGAGWLRGRARDELRLAGGRRRRAENGRVELTPAERRVAELAADGRTNAEIGRALHVSVNTVETHLRRIYLKLGINSRRQLV